MNPRLRLACFATVVVLLAALLGWAGSTKWQRLQELRRSFAAVESDAFYLSDDIESSIREMQQSLLRFGSRKDPSDQVKFNRKGQELKRLIASHRTASQIPRQEELMQRMDRAFDTYVARSIILMDERMKAVAGSPTSSVLEAAEKDSEPVFELCRQLAAAERESLGRFLRDSNESVVWLQRLLVALLVLLLGLGVVLALSVYREMLAPLRSQLRQSRAIAQRHEKLASLGTLAAGLAHEIRNPLTAINVRIHSLKRNLVKDSSEHEDAIVIDSEIRRLEGIVQEFLQFARPAEPKFVIVSADSLLAKVQKLLSAYLEKNLIALTLESPPDVWVRVDPHQVEQALINLVQNAAESIQRDGKIALSARAETSRLAGRSRPVVVLEVSDNGKGIPPEVQKRLFDPFFTTKDEGTGLGLSIAARIIEQQGGTLQFKTEVNRGTTFAIILPRVEQQAHEPAT